MYPSICSTDTLFFCFMGVLSSSAFQCKISAVSFLNWLLWIKQDYCKNNFAFFYIGLFTEARELKIIKKGIFREQTYNHCFTLIRYSFLWYETIAYDILLSKPGLFFWSKVMMYLIQSIKPLNGQFFQT